MYFSEERFGTSRKRRFCVLLGKERFIKFSEKSVLRVLLGKVIALLGKGCFKNNPGKVSNRKHELLEIPVTYCYHELYMGKIYF
jgi:hypothetical protein